MPELRTERLLMRPIGGQDREALVTYCSDLCVAKWMIHMPHPYTTADADAFIAKVSSKQGQVWGITKDTVLIGMMGTAGEFGYWLGRPFWGQGLATEAATAVITDYFAVTDAPDINASHMDANVASARLLSKLGFVDMGATTIRSAATGRAAPGRAVRLARARWHEMHHG